MNLPGRDDTDLTCVREIRPTLISACDGVLECASDCPRDDVLADDDDDGIIHDYLRLSVEGPETSVI